jgi:predicted nucleotidyltransferase
MYKQKLEELLETLPDCELIFLTKYGSHLFGLDTPESDLDIKGVFMPSQRMMYLNKIPKTVQIDTKKEKGQKNTKDDVDIQIFSLQYFFELAMKGETVAIDMLHSTKYSVLKSTLMWEAVHQHKEMFYSKNLKAFMGYAKNQAAKYGVKGDRLNVIKEFVEVMNFESGDDKLSDYWDRLPITKHSSHIVDTPNGIKQYQICGKILQETMRVDYALEIIWNYKSKYGTRAIQAQDDSGVDWKAISHALRAAYEVKDILTKGTIEFPLVNASYIKSVKLGEKTFNEVSEHLDFLIDQVTDLTESSLLPENVNREKIEDFLYDIIKAYRR